MKRDKPLSRRTAVKRVNRERRKRREAAGEVYGSFYAYVCSLKCAVRGEGSECYGVVVGHHLKTVGSGGKDAGNVAPLCQKHHSEIHTIGPTAFDAKYFNDLKLYAARLWADYNEMED